MSLILDGTGGITFNNATTQASAGSVLQVVSGTTTTPVSNSTTTYADTGLTATITPKFSNSKILVLVTHSCCYKSSNNASNAIEMYLLRGASQISYLSSSNGSTGSALVNYFSIGGSFLDSPATTSATTYKTQFRNNTNAASVSVQIDSTISTITLMEIAQ